MTGLTFGEAARRLGCDVNVVRRWVRHEECPVIVDGRRKRIPRSWVDEQLALLGTQRRAVAMTPDPGMSEFTDKLIECADRDARDELADTLADVCMEHFKTIEVLALLAILRPVKDRADVEDMFRSD